MPKLTKSGPAYRIDGRVNPALWYETVLSGTNVVVKVYQYEYTPTTVGFLEQSDCIRPTFYTNKGPYSGDHTRTQVNADGSPAWPVVSKEFE